MPKGNEEVYRRSVPGRPGRFAAIVVAIAGSLSASLPVADEVVLRIGVVDAEPYTAAAPDGTVSGYAVDLYGLIGGETPEFVPLGGQTALLDALERGEIDLALAVPVDIAAARGFPATRAYATAPLAIASRSGDAYSVPGDLAGLRIGIGPDTSAHAIAPIASGAQIVSLPDARDGLFALLSQELDVFISQRHMMSAAIRRAGLDDRIHISTLDGLGIPLGMVFRDGLGGEATALDGALAEVIGSSRDLTLRAQWISLPPAASADGSGIGFIVAAIALGLLLTGGALALLVRSREKRRNAHELEQRLAAQEAELGRQHRFLEAVIGNATDGIVAVDRSGKIVQANPAAERMHARPLRGENLSEVTRAMQISVDPGGDGSELPQLAVLRGEFAAHASRQSWKVGGRTRDVRVSARVLEGAADETAAAGAVLTFNDVTEERSSRTAIARSKKLLEVLLNAMPAGIVAFDSEGRVTLMNRVARELLGVGDMEPPFAWPKTCKFMSRDARTPLGRTEHPVVRALAGFELRGEVRHLVNTASDASAFVRINSARVPAEQSSEIHTVVVMVDVTLDEQRHQQIERASRLDALGQLTSGIAHDFNNLLSAMLGAVQLAMAEENPEKRSRHHKMAIRSMHRGSELTRRLMSFANAQPGQPVSVAVKPLLEEFLHLAERTIVASIKLDLDCPDETLHLYCDRGQIESAVLNLVLNARDAILRSGKGDCITISARPFAAAADGTRGSGDYGQIIVRDNGPGMSQEVRRRAVDPFFSTKQVAAGAGLGLSIVASFVQSAGGFFDIRSTPGEGTEVTLTVPQAMPWLSSAETHTTPHLINGSGQRVLVVEDEEDLREITVELIASLGFEPHASSSGPEAYAYVHDGHPVDAVLTDIVMPGGMNGFELAEKLRAERPDLPLIYMSGYAGMAADQKGRVGAPLIRKPCSIEDLSSAFHTVLRQM